MSINYNVRRRVGGILIFATSFCRKRPLEKRSHNKKALIGSSNTSNFWVCVRSKVWKGGGFRRVRGERVFRGVARRLAGRRLVNGPAPPLGQPPPWPGIPKTHPYRWEAGRYRQKPIVRGARQPRPARPRRESLLHFYMAVAPR